jgi:3-oxoacyl-[acyl-carrier-protein] synthase-3
MSIRIAGTGRYVPEKVLTNADLERMVDTNDEWIRTRTGIEERHIAAENETTSDMAYHAGLQALDAAGISGADIDLIIVATTTPDHTFPNTATILQNRFGAKNAFCFDIYTACTGLISSLEIAFSLLESRKNYNRALVFGAEKLSCITNWTDRNTCVLFGDGASCILLEKTDDNAPSALLASSSQEIEPFVMLAP